MKNSDIPFQFVGNALALDLVNTQVARGGETIDLIATETRLADWLRCSNAPPLDKWTAEDKQALFALRAACAQIATSRLEQTNAPRAALETVNAHLLQSASAQTLTQIEGAFHLSAQTNSANARAFLAQIAQSLATLVAETDAKRLKTCAHDECILMFKDTSKSGRRRWCSMETCGNRAKAATFRAASQS